MIAAAGNRRGGQPSAWPLLPAAWELRRPSYLPFALGGKRLYAVGGVDSFGLPLPNYRRGGLPRRAACGDHAVGEVGPESPTAMYTGSSVSAAVTSAIAAVVWHERPRLRPAQVMKLIGRSGDRLDLRAEFYGWRWLSGRLPFLIEAPRIRRLTLCRAVERARRQPGGKRSTCPAWERRPADLSMLAGNATDVLPISQSGSLLPDPPSCRTPDPEPPPRTFLGETSTALCAMDLPDVGSERWVFPQPEDNPCPGCTLIPPAQHAALSPIVGHVGYGLAVGISQEWRDKKVVIESAALDLDRYSGGEIVERKTYGVPRGAIDTMLATPGAYYLVDGIDIPSLDGWTASLNFKLRLGAEGTTRSVQSPVYVDP